MRISVFSAPLRVRAAFYCLMIFAYPLQSYGMGLHELLVTIEDTSPRLAEVSAQVAEVRAELTTARGWPNPQLSGGQEYVGADEVPVESSIGIEQNLGFLWSQSARVSAKRAAYEAAVADFREQRQQVEAAVIIAAYEFDGLRQLEGMLDSLLTRTTKLRSAVQTQYKLGDVSLYDRERFEFEFADLNLERVQIRSQRQAAAAALVALTGISGKAIEELELDWQQTVPEDFDDSGAALEFGLEHRNLLRAARLKLQAANRSVTSARASQMPGLTISAGQLSIEGGDSGLFWEAGIELPLFQQRRGEVQKSRVLRRTSELQQSAARQAVELEIRNAVAQRKQIKLIAGISTEDRLTRATQNIERGALLYLEGELSVFELVDVLQSGYEAQVSAMKLRNAAVSADIDLLKAVGYDILENSHE
jgi:outer membrane protein TolC